MKKIIILVSLVAFGFAFGCKPSADTTASPSAKSTTNQLDKAQAAAKTAARQLREYSFEQKADFVNALQAQLDDLNRSLDELAAKIEKSSDAARAEAKPKLDALRGQAVQLKTQLAAIKDATPSTWNGVKADSEKAYNALKDGVTQSRQWISDKIAP